MSADPAGLVPPRPPLSGTDAGVAALTAEVTAEVERS